MSSCMVASASTKRSPWPASHSYNSRLQYTSSQATSTVGTAISLSYCYTSFAFATGCSTTASGNNGNVTGIINNAKTGRTLNTTYDSLIRISGASSSTTGADCWGQNFLTDALGNLNTIALSQCSGTQLSGQLCYDADFTPYGQEMSHSDRLQTTACTPNYRFTGYEYDPETGLHYARARYYSVRLGRFLSTDPRGGSVGNSQSHNSYAYVGNNPQNYTDPAGLGPCSAAKFPQLCGGGFGGGGTGCSVDGVWTPCDIAFRMEDQGAADRCPSDICGGFDDKGQYVQFRASADGCSGYLPFSAPAGASSCDIANALKTVSDANGTPMDPTQLTGKAKQVYDLLVALGVSPDDITIYQNGTQSFSAVLTDAGFDQLQSSSLVDSNYGDAFLHDPYTDGGRSDQNPSLHFVWFDPILTDYVGGTGVYMQFHSDSSNPWNGGFWQHGGAICLRLRVIK